MLQTTTQDATIPLKDAIRRALRGLEQRWVVLALHLSRLQPPAPRPHHMRIARSVLDDAAARRGGQLYTLLNGDLVLLFPASDGGVGLAATLAQLFSPDAPDATLLLSRWLMPVQMEECFAFLDAVPMLVAVPVAQEAEAKLAAVSRLSDTLQPGRCRELLERQTGILVATGGGSRVLPLFRELRFSLAALEARASVSGQIMADPFLFRHLVAKLDRILVASAITDLRQESGALTWAHGGKFALHLNLSIDTILSPALDQLTVAADSCAARLAVEIALVEACADADAYIAARERLRAAGVAVVLDDVSHHALMMIRPAMLQADLLKLYWSRQLLQCGDALDAALRQFGPTRIILQQADTEDAVRWGLVRGIRRFQGQHVDNILGVGRIEACPESGRCTLRACVARERETTSAGRLGCDNLPLLDAAMPSRKQAA